MVAVTIHTRRTLDEFDDFIQNISMSNAVNLDERDIL